MKSLSRAEPLFLLSFFIPWIIFGKIAWAKIKEASITPENPNIIIIKQNDKKSPAKKQNFSTGYPQRVFLNELLPSPTGPDKENEWIEIYNKNNFEVDLSGWKIKDLNGRTHCYSFPEKTKMPGQSFLVLKRPVTKITLNNDGDGLVLIQPNGQIIDSVSYEKAPLGKSYSRIENQWVWNEKNSPGKNNPSPKIPKENDKDKQNSNNEKPASENISEQGTAQASKNFPKESFPWFIFLISAINSLALAVIILFLKCRLKD